MELGTIIPMEQVLVVVQVDMLALIVQRKNVKIMVVGIQIAVIPEADIVVVPVVMAEKIVP